MVRIDELYKTQEPNYVSVDRRALTEGADTGVAQRLATPAFMSHPNAPVFEVQTEAGYSVKATRWHRFHVGEKGKFVRLKNLKVGDEIWIQSGKGQFGSEGSRELGEVMGLIAGDGHFTNRGKGKVAARLDFWGDKEGVAERMLDNVHALMKDLPPSANGRRYDVGLMEVADRDLKSIRSTILAKFLEKYDFDGARKLQVPEAVWKGSEECVKGYLQALFYADGTVNISGGRNKSGDYTSCSVRLASSTEEFLKEVQVLLANFGVFSRISFRREAQARMMPNGKGEHALYQCKSNYELIVDGSSRDVFATEIGFLGTEKQAKVEKFISAKSRASNVQNFRVKVSAIVPAGTVPVYDVTQVDQHSVIFCGIATGQCGEQPLPSYGCCCLGSVNLTVFVRDPFGENPVFDFDLMSKVCKVAVRMLDNVLDKTHWPLPEQLAESKNKRRVGLGFTGLGNALAMLKIKYSSPEGLEMAARMSAAMRDAAYESSSDTAVEKGSFLLFHAEKYLASGFASRLPEGIKAKIRKQGLRNSHLLSIAPTGTISLAFGDNASNGIEPPFSYFYNRKKREQDGSWRSYQVEDHGWRVFKAQGGDVANLPPYFVTALEMSALDHMNMVAAVAPFIDSAISKCVAKGTRLMTNRGLMKIEDMGSASTPDTFADAKVGLKVLCPDGAWRSVKQHYYGGVRPTVRIRMANGNVLTGSDQHRLKTTAGWTRMSDLKVGDWIMSRRSARLDNEGGLPLPSSSFAPQAKRLRTPERMTPELALFLGMICSDGHLLDGPGRVALHQNDMPVGEAFSRLAMDLFGAEAKHTVDPRTGVNCWMFNSRAICRWIKNLVGYRSYDKHAPEAVMLGSAAEMRAFLSGLTLDGYKVTQGGRESTVLYDGRSEVLARHAFSMLVALGYQPRLTDKTVAGHGYKVWGARAAGIDFSLEPHKNSALSVDNEYVAVPSKAFNERLDSKSTAYFAQRNWRQSKSVVCKEQQLSKNFPGISMSSEHIFHKITELDLSHGEVYDIEVEESHDYLVDGVVSHNTVNVPGDYPYEEFKDLYMQAWKSGLKGIATYRPNATLGSVLSVDPVPAPAADPAASAARIVEDFNDDANRRLSIKTIPEPVLGSLLWPDRPRFPAGNPAWTYMVDHPDGDFTLFVGEAEEADLHEGGRRNARVPFEIWVQGRKAPRGLGAIAKTLSLDLRAADKAWISKKLEALAKTTGEAPFQMPMPPTGEPEWMHSSAQAVAKLILWRAEQLGALDDEDSTPMEDRAWIKRQPLIDSLFSDKEPKTGTGGTMGWMVDVLNPITGDDFLMGLKEITLPDGSHRPYSVWMSGEYPKAFDGLCKLLSLDMRVIDPAWIGLKLRKLTTYSEPLGEFMAKIPGHPEGKAATWPSTVAYVAALVMHRFTQLGILDSEGRPISDMGLMAPRHRAQHQISDSSSQGADVAGGVKRTAGKVCPECRAPAMIKKDGCEFCTECGHVGSCG